MFTCVLVYLSTCYNLFRDSMDIRAGVIAAVVLSVIGAILIFRSGIRALQAARKLTFYRIRRQRERSGWTTLLVALALLSCGIWLSFFGEPVAYR